MVSVSRSTAMPFKLTDNLPRCRSNLPKIDLPILAPEPRPQRHGGRRQGVRRGGHGRGGGRAREGGVQDRARARGRGGGSPVTTEGLFARRGATRAKGCSGQKVQHVDSPNSVIVPDERPRNRRVATPPPRARHRRRRRRRRRRGARAAPPLELGPPRVELASRPRRADRGSDSFRTLGRRTAAGRIGSIERGG